MRWVRKRPLIAHCDPLSRWPDLSICKCNMSDGRRAENALGLRDRADDMVKRGCRDGIDQRSAVAIELIVPATRHRMAQIVPVQPYQGFERLVDRALLSGLGLRNPGLRDLGLGPEPPRGLSHL